MRIARLVEVPVRIALVVEAGGGDREEDKHNVVCVACVCYGS